MRKKLLSSIIALVMVLSLLPATALAADETWQEVSDGTSLVEALQSGGNIRVASPIEVTATETVEITKPVVLDLNGKTVDWTTSAKEAVKVQKGGDLTIQDEADTGALSFTSTYSNSYHSGISVYTDGNLTITGGLVSYYHASTSGRAIYTNINATFTMTGGTVSVSGASNYAMYLYGTGLHRITGGQLVFDPETTASAVYGIYANGSNVEISDLTVNASSIPDAKTVICIRSYNSSTPITISGGTYIANGNEDSYAVGSGSGNKTSISGGLFNGAVRAAAGRVTGGIFSVRPSASYLALGKIYEKQDDGYYHVVDGNYVAYVGDIGYLTWEELFAAIQEDEKSTPVYILSDAAEITVPEGKNVTFYNSKKCSIDKIINNGTCKVITYALPDTEVVNNGTLSLGHEVGSLINNAGGVVDATANAPKVTGAVTNHGTMTFSKGSYLGAITNDGTLTITGGTFAQDVKDLCAEGYTTQQNKEGTWDVMEDVPHVAEIDGYWYGTLQAAMSAAQSGDTVKLLSDTTLSTKVSVSNKTLTLDMNGHKITYGASGSNYGAMVFMGASDIIITGNGTFDFDNTYAADDSKAEGRIFDVENSAVLTIENGTFYAGLTCVLADNNAKTMILGGTYSASQPYGGSWFLLNLQDKTEAQIQVYGGTFAQYNPAESHTEPGGPVSFCAEGYTVTSDKDEEAGITYYTVGPDSTQNFVAQIGERKFVSLDSAVKSADDDDTIELLDDVTITTALDITKDITIDGNGNTVRADHCVGFYIKDDLEFLTVKNLNLKGVLDEGETAGEGGNGSFMGIGTYNLCYGVDKLTLTNVTIDGFSYGMYFGKNPTGGNGPFNENNVKVDADNLTIQNCYIKGAYFEKLTDSSFTDSRFLNNGKDPEKVQDSFKTWLCGVDINLKNGSYQDVIFDGCVFEGNGANSGTALLLKARDDGNYGEATKLDGVIITGCTFENNNAQVTPIIIGEAGKDNKTPVNVQLQPGVAYTDNLDENTAYTVAFKSDKDTTIGTLLTAGEITLPAAPEKEDYVFQGWSDGTNTYDAGEEVTITKDTTFTAVWSVISSGTSYSITVEDSDNGSVTASRTRANKGLTITLTVKADEGYKLDTIAVTDKDGNEVKLTDKGDGKYTFAMPASAVTVKASFAKDDAPVDTGLPFTDVKADDWFFEPVKYVYDNKLMDGTSATTFAPLMTTNRAMIVTILWRLEGQPESDATLSFTDVESGVWYTDAVNWAASKGIVKGYSDTVFAPNDTVTREQLATILYRYAETKGYDVTAKGDLTTFADGANTSSWAAEAMEWAVGSGLLSGKDGGKLDPTGTATRAEVATILMRFVESVSK